MSPESSLTVKKPSSRDGLLEARKNQTDALVSAMLADGSRPAYLNRDKIPEPFLAYADTYHELTGQEPTRRVLQDWLATFSDWASEGIQPKHVRVAHKESLSRFVVLRPGSLTNTAAACRARLRLRDRKARDKVRETHLRLKEMERERQGAVPMPPEIRRRLDAFLERNTIKKEAQ